MRRIAPLLPLGLVLLLGLGLRLLVWRWHQQYPLGGDEREYFEQALRWLQGRGYQELPLMRPPLYTVFLAVVFQLFDSQVQRVRLVQALVSTGTIGLVWLWTRAALADHPQRSRCALIAAGLYALCYTFAANATELLTETLFVAGLTLTFWLLALARRGRWRYAALAGLTIGALCLLRSVALPLLPLGALWLLVQAGGISRQASGDRRGSMSLLLRSFVRPQGTRFWRRASLLGSLFFVLGSLVVITPWTIRNYLRYDTLIVIDTTGAENLWLDNGLVDRDTVKQQLYAMGEDRGGRQQLSIQQGRAAILADPARFMTKVWGEAKKFFALEYFDDLRTRRAIWVPPLEVWLRLLLGDGIWLVVLVGGVVGLWLGPDDRLKWLLVPWALYILATGLLFHVELRYRLPLYPALLPYVAWTLSSGWSALWGRRSVASGRRQRWRVIGAGLTVGAALLLLLLHRPYLGEGALLARKHYQLWQSARLRAADQADAARVAAAAALRLDPESALARVALGLAAPPAEAQRWWREAVAVLPAHPYAHLLLGNRLRAQGELDAARRELAFERSSLEDLQQWTRSTFERPAAARVDLGDGLDLGAIGGFHLPTDDPAFRWSTARATVYGLTPGAFLHLRLAGPELLGAPPTRVAVALDGVPLTTLTVGPQWQTYSLPIPEQLRARVTDLALTSTTLRPRTYDRASPDNRALGVRVDWIATGATPAAP